MGVNDTDKTKPEPGNLDTDIDLSDYNNNADTFAGNYGGLIQRLRSIQPRCKIFIVSMPRNSNLNPIIQAMPTKFDNVFLIDLKQYQSMYENPTFKDNYYLGGHLNPAGYLYTAYLFMAYIDWIIRKNPGKFKDVGLIGTTYTTDPT
ncbi:SGNH/GDSL hydrolase family protein [Bacteroides sp. An19]|uniref:SGNH/GDSL hydrolase family protein n=1 Tax=Bacteroides sp. An19 TaxID=1965580 RepID=UPI000B3946C0|nr:SGNH/GDSL hydrolase family protein [Bacteroides sp. An19]OUP26217.1 hypothetical protein B5F25_20695 [Bacteroides sp. An19]